MIHDLLGQGFILGCSTQSFVEWSRFLSRGNRRALSNPPLPFRHQLNEHLRNFSASLFVTQPPTRFAK